ncbi:MAG TPA: Holliday junction resolvase RuvX [Aquabacterium sp.]|nr:Holliday junction resolvase RuvX [Aquabacterium sp.]
MTQTYLAFDFGLKRVGVACGNSLLRQASPLRTIAAEGDARFVQIKKLVDEWRPDALVVGVPFHPDGAEHEITLRARRFARQLQGRFHLKVHEVDERYSSVEAERDDPDDLDSAAAAIILQQFFNETPSSTPPLEGDA